VFTTEAPLGEVAQVVDSNVALAQRVVLFKVNTSRMVASFLKLHFLGGFGRAEIESYASGSTALGIRADRLKRTLVPTPPLKEQRAIVETVTSALSPGVRLMGVVGEQIAKLREYRRALISAAVTGKIDVRQEAA
jgi:type I restriction enzyme S subunit